MEIVARVNEWGVLASLGENETVSAAFFDTFFLGGGGDQSVEREGRKEGLLIS